MKYLKKYESLEEPEVGDYVLMKSEANKKVANLINQTIGRINKLIQPYFDSRVGIEVKYDFPRSVLKNLRIDNTRVFDRDQIVAFGKTKKELELKKQANKYNL